MSEKNLPPNPSKSNKTPKSPSATLLDKDNKSNTSRYQNQMKEAEGKEHPLKATDRMAPQFSGHAEGQKPNMGGDAKRRPNADHEKGKAG